MGFDERDGGVWQAAWVDSFHTAPSIMRLEGAAREDGAIDVLGSWQPPEGPPWGWRIVLRPDPGTLVVEHFVVTPAGEESVAVVWELAATEG